MKNLTGWIVILCLFVTINLYLYTSWRVDTLSKKESIKDQPSKPKPNLLNRHDKSKELKKDLWEGCLR